MKKISLEKFANSLNKHFLNNGSKAVVINNLCIALDTYKVLLPRITLLSLQKIFSIDDIKNVDMEKVKKSYSETIYNIVEALWEHKDEFMVEEQELLRDKACKTLEKTGFTIVDKKDEDGDIKCYFGNEDCTWIFFENSLETIAKETPFSSCLNSGKEFYNLALENYQLKQRFIADRQKEIQSAYAECDELIKSWHE